MTALNGCRSALVGERTLIRRYVPPSPGGESKQVYSGSSRCWARFFAHRFRVSTNAEKPIAE